MNPFLRALVAAGLLDQDTADRMSRMLSPEQAQAYAEQRMAALWAGGLQGQLSRLMEVLRSNDYDLPPAVMESFWKRETRTLYEAVLPGLTEVAQDAAITAAVRGGGFTMWNAVNERVISWVEDYYINPDALAYGSIPNLNIEARTIVGKAFNAWQRGELEVAANAEGLPRLILALEPAFGPKRAALIGTTETTRIYMGSEVAAGDADENTDGYTWLTARDERVCVTCGPLDGQFAAKGGGGFISDGKAIGFNPAHPGCRCSITPESKATRSVPLGSGGAGGWDFNRPNMRQTKGVRRAA